MSLVSAAVKRPVSTLASVIAIVLLGSVSLSRLPVSLLPDVTLPVLTIRTIYEGAAATEVSRFIAEELQGGEPSLSNIARRMAMSQRTLQRRLELERTSFADLLDTTRRHFAQAYLKEPNLALTEIAYLLGFSEQSAFTRAFHRWFGAAPSQVRSRALAT